MYLFDFLEKEYSSIELKFDVDMLKRKTFFITGTNGLIGCNIVNFLWYINERFKLNLNVICHSYSSPVSWLPHSNNFSYYVSNLIEYIPNIKFDFLIHTATYGQPKKFIKNKLDTIKLNTDVLINLLKMSEINKAKVLFISSSEIYGSPPQELNFVTETYNGNVSTVSDRAVYAESKRLGETICSIFSKQGLYIKIIRLSIGYGPGVKLSDSRFMNEFIKRTLSEDKLKMMDSGKALRNFCFISDVIEMLFNVFIASRDMIYNICGINNMSIHEIAKIITSSLNSNLLIPELDESIEGTPNYLLLDNRKYCDEFCKYNFIDIKYGIKKTIEWYKILIREEENEI